MNTAIQDGFDLGWKLAWVLRGWTPDTLLQTYDAERRPVGLHNVERASHPQGANQTPDEALPWDLNGRVSHHWTDDAHRTSTIDLLGEGLTLLTGPAATARMHTEGGGRPRPLTCTPSARPSPTPSASPPTERSSSDPDGHEITRWDDLANRQHQPRCRHRRSLSRGQGPSPPPDHRAPLAFRHRNRLLPRERNVDSGEPTNNRQRSVTADTAGRRSHR